LFLSCQVFGLPITEYRLPITVHRLPLTGHLYKIPSFPSSTEALAKVGTFPFLLTPQLSGIILPNFAFLFRNPTIIPSTDYVPYI